MDRPTTYLLVCRPVFWSRDHCHVTISWLIKFAETSPRWKYFGHVHWIHVLAENTSEEQHSCRQWDSEYWALIVQSLTKNNITVSLDAFLHWLSGSLQNQSHVQQEPRFIEIKIVIPHVQTRSSWIIISCECGWVSEWWSRKCWQSDVNHLMGGARAVTSHCRIWVMTFNDVISGRVTSRQLMT